MSLVQLHGAAEKGTLLMTSTALSMCIPVLWDEGGLC